MRAGMRQQAIRDSKGNQKTKVIFFIFLLHVYEAKTLFIPSQLGGIRLLMMGTQHSRYNIFYINTSSWDEIRPP